MLHGMETVPMTSSHVKKREVTEIKMCKWACGHTKIPCEKRYHQGETDCREYHREVQESKNEVVCTRKEARTKYVGRNTLDMVPPGSRKRGTYPSRYGWTLPTETWEILEQQNTKSRTELAGGELCLPSRPHNLVGAARRRNPTIWSHLYRS